MTTGTITSIVGDGVELLVTTTVNGAGYAVNMGQVFFDSLDTPGKIMYLSNLINSIRMTNRSMENVHQDLIGTVIPLPTLTE